MATSFLFKTAVDGLINDPAQIDNGLITGDKLAASVDLPVGTLLNGTSLSTQITAAAGGYDFHESVKTVIRLPTSDLAVGWDYNTTTKAVSVNFTSYDLSVPGTYNCGVAVNIADRVAVMPISPSGAPDPGRATGIYTIAGYVAGVYSLTRTADANSGTNFNQGALTFLGEAVSPLQAGQGLVLVGGEFDWVTAVWAIAGAAFPTATAADEVLISTGAGTSYTTKLAGDLVSDVLDANLSADVLTFLASADAANARTNLGVQDMVRLIPLSPGAQSTTSTVDVVIGGAYFDPAVYAITGRTTTLTLELMGQVSAGGVTGTLTLYNLDDVISVTSSITATSATYATAAVTLPGAAKRYELRLKKSGGAVADYALVYGVNLRVTWS